MKISWKWLNELVDLKPVGTPQKLGEILTSLGLEVEAVRSQADGLEAVITAQVVKKEKHPGADRLSLCQVSTGSGEPLQIVCGAQNFKEGDKVALAQVGAKLPNGLQIKAGKIRDVLSNGMLCSEEELKLKDKSDGILLLPADTQLGKPLAEVLGLDDAVLELSLTPNRGDCLSHLGVAREVAAYLGTKVKLPKVPELPMGGSPFSTALDAGDLSQQFWGCFIKGVKVGPSPAWVVRRLEAVGARSINNVVDATNLALYELGQPQHAYDASRLQGKGLRVRASKAGEELPLLDGSKVTLSGEELVIADEAKPVSLAGVMGGGNSEVLDSTVDVFLECAEFHPARVRRAATRHVKHSDSSHRFERGVDPAGQRLALSRLAGLVTELAGGKIVGATVAAAPSRDPAKGPAARVISLDPAYVTYLLGVEVAAAEVERVLTNLGCRVDKQGKTWSVTAPSHRLDLSIREDLVEEIARFIGYEKIPVTLPSITSSPLTRTELPEASDQELLEKAKDALADAGLREVLQYSFMGRDWLREFGLESTVVLRNPLSAEQEALVPSLVPGLVKTVLDNQNRHFGSEGMDLRIFEIRPTFHGPGALPAEGFKSVSRTETGVTESWRLAFAMTGARFSEGLKVDRAPLDFADTKAVAEALLSRLGARGVRFMAMGEGTRLPQDPRYSLFHPGQSVAVLAGKDVIGGMGLLHPKLARRFKLRAPLWIAEWDWAALRKMLRRDPVAFKPWSEFPSIERDFALVVREGIDADKITQVALKAGQPLAKVVKVFDIYKGSQVAEGMTSIAVRVTFLEESRSLQETEADEISSKILARWKTELGIELRS